MNDYVSKPIDPVKLLERIAFWLGDAQHAVPGESPGAAGGDMDTEPNDDTAAALEELLDTRDDAAGDLGSQKRMQA